MSNHEETVRLYKQLEQQFVAISQTIGEIAARQDLLSAAAAAVPRFLTEPQMAEHLGITKRAIQHRRLRGQIPSSVMQKIGSDWIYSVARYEDWLESLWPVPVAGPVAKGRKRLNRSYGSVTGTPITKLV